MEPRGWRLEKRAALKEDHGTTAPAFKVPAVLKRAVKSNGAVRCSAAKQVTKPRKRYARVCQEPMMKRDD